MSRTAAKWVLSIFALIATLSLAVLLVFPSIYKNKINFERTISEGTLLTKAWRDIPLPIHEKIYFFNITNAEDFAKRGEPLNVTEVGPYTYVSRWIKRDPVWNSNGTVSYREIRTYQFVREESVGSQDDVITTLNGPLIIGANMLKDYNIGLRLLASLAIGIEGETIVIQRKVRELVYDGYEDFLIKLAPIMKPGIPYKDGRFSWLWGKNNTNDGVFTVFTGADDSTKAGIIDKWNGLEKLRFWKEDSCNIINGTSIETGPPLDDDQKNYVFYQTIFCRSIPYSYTGDVRHYGILTKRFEATSSVFANGTENPDNACYDVHKEYPSGVLDVSPCQFGAPVFISFPHFYMADPSYLNSIHGLNPEAEDYGSHVDVHPLIGMSLDIVVKFQVNLKTERVKGIVQLDDVREGIFPIFWTELSVHLDENWAHYLKSQLENPKIISYSVLGIVLAVSLALVIAAGVILHKYRKDDCDDDEPLLDANEDIRENRRQPQKEKSDVTYSDPSIAS